MSIILFVYVMYRYRYYMKPTGLLHRLKHYGFVDLADSNSFLYKLCFDALL